MDAREWNKSNRTVADLLMEKSASEVLSCDTSDTWDYDLETALGLSNRLIDFVRQWPDEYLQQEKDAILDLHAILLRMNGY